MPCPRGNWHSVADFDRGRRTKRSQASVPLQRRPSRATSRVYSPNLALNTGHMPWRRAKAWQYRTIAPEKRIGWSPEGHLHIVFPPERSAFRMWSRSAFARVTGSVGTAGLDGSGEKLQHIALRYWPASDQRIPSKNVASKIRNSRIGGTWPTNGRALSSFRHCMSPWGLGAREALYFHRYIIFNSTTKSRLLWRLDLESRLLNVSGSWNEEAGTSVRHRS